MPAKDNKDIVRRLLDEVWNQGKMEKVEEIVSAKCNWGDGDVPPTRSYGMGGPRDVIYAVGTYRELFPDLRIEVQELLSERDRVVAIWTFRGTHSGKGSHVNLSDIAPTGGEVVARGAGIFRVASGNVHDFDVFWSPASPLVQVTSLRAASAGS
jgi:hypothetical protein